MGLLLRLVDRAEEVHDGLDGCEGEDWDLDEECEPLGHSTVPEAGEFHACDIDAVDAFVRLEAGFGVDEFGEVVSIAVAVF